MKRAFNYLLILLFVVSCKGQENPKQIIDASKIKEITITNKVNYNHHHFKEGSKIIKDRNQIEKIISVFVGYTENEKKAKGDVDVKNSNGFFEVEFYEGEKEFYYTINYTIYDGIVLRNDLNGELYKNDRLEAIISSFFIE